MTAIAHFFRCELSDCAILNDYTLCRHINEGEMKRRFRGRPRDYAVAVAVSALALLISLLFRPVFESNPFLLFFVAVAASTSIGGLGPGIVTILFAVVAVEVFFFTGGRSTDTVLLDLIRLTAFVLAALFIASIHQRLERSRRELARATSKRDAILRGISDGVIAVDDAHIVTLISPLQPEKAPRPRVVTPSGNITLVRAVQLENAWVPMLVRLVGRSTLVSARQPKNAPSSILVTRLGIVRLLSPVQPSKAHVPMLVMLLGIVKLVSPVQRVKAPDPKLVTLLGIVTSVSPVQAENAEFPMRVTLLGIV